MNTDNIRDPLATEVIRLREGIEALITSGNSIPVSTVRASALRNLLDREAKLRELHFCEDCGCGFEHGCVCGNCDEHPPLQGNHPVDTTTQEEQS